MYPEPSVPFYMALSIYVPLLVLTYFAVYIVQRLLGLALKRFTSMWNSRGLGGLSLRRPHLPPTPGRA